MASHEIDGVGCRHLRRDDEIALILAVVVVDQDEHAPVARLVDDRLRADEHVGAALDQLFEPGQRVGGRVPLVRPELAQAVGVKPGGPGEARAADFAGGDDGFEPFDQGGAHRGRNNHIVM